MYLFVCVCVCVCVCDCMCMQCICVCTYVCIVCFALLYMYMYVYILLSVVKRNRERDALTFTELHQKLCNQVSSISYLFILITACCSTGAPTRTPQQRLMCTYVRTSYLPTIPVFPGIYRDFSIASALFSRFLTF